MAVTNARASLDRLRHTVTASPLRVAVLAAAAWALGTLVLTGLALAVEVRQSGWHGVVAPASLLPALIFATTSYLLRFLRWHLLARRVAPGLSIRSSFVVGTIGFALIMTPGRAGEALKLLLLRRHAAVPVATSAPIFVLEKVCEGTALALLAFVASFFLPWADAVPADRRLVVAGALLLGLALALTFWRPVAAVAPRLPVVRRVLARPRLARLWSDLLRGGDRLLSWPVLLVALSVSIVARACDGLVVFWVAGTYGMELTLAAAWFIVGSSGFIGGVSMLPGGAGVVELTLVGLLLAFGADPAGAVAAALTARILIFWLWVALGLTLAVPYAAGRWGVASREAP